MIITLDKVEKGSAQQCNGSNDKKHLLCLSHSQFSQQQQH